MAVEIHPVPVRDVFATLCYFAVDGDSGHGVLVDAGAQPGLLARTAALAQSVARLEKMVPPDTLLLSGHSQPIAAAQL